MDIFEKQKKDVLAKKDKSSRGHWDEKIASLCRKINFLKDYYTTSSCSGRVVLMIEQDKKSRGLFFRKYHYIVSFSVIKKDLGKISKKTNKKIKFKLEPCAMHVVCRDLESAQNLCKLVRSCGWKRTGIIHAEKRFVIEMAGTEHLEFPIILKNKILVDDNFLKIVVRDSNHKLKRTWTKIDRLEKGIKNLK